MLALEARDLGRRYPRKWGLRNCSFAIPEGKVAGLVGPNGAGKSTLLRLAAGISRATTGEVRVLGEAVRPNCPGGYPKVGYLDQERPLYKHFRVEELLKYGQHLNRQWYPDVARRWLDELHVPVAARFRSLSIGQQAQVALALCLGKQPELLLLDEPAASLDPLARRKLFGALMDTVADRGTTVFLSSHILSELEPVCDYLVILSNSEVQLSGETERILANHRILVGPREQAAPEGGTVIATANAGRQTTLVVRDLAHRSVGWQEIEPTLEEIVLAYLEVGQ